MKGEGLVRTHLGVCKSGGWKQMDVQVFDHGRNLQQHRLCFLGPANEERAYLKDLPLMSVHVIVLFLGDGAVFRWQC